MTTNSVGAVGTGADSVTTKAKGQLDRDAFLNLLITQLRNQDPLKPVEDKEFIAQLAQFSSLEQMQNMNSGLQNVNSGLQQLLQAQSTMPQGLALMGRTIKAVSPDGELDEKLGVKVLIGKVDGLDFSSGQTLLKVDGKLVPIENLISVS